MKRSLPDTADTEEEESSGTSGASKTTKACEPCRARKTRCDISTQVICSECLKRDQADQCRVREKARPQRPSSKKSMINSRPITTQSSKATRYDNIEDGAQASALNSSSPGRFQSKFVETPRDPPVPAAMVVQELIEEGFMRQFGTSITVSPETENLFAQYSGQNLSLADIGIIPGHPETMPRAIRWITTHINALHHNTPFLHLPQLIEAAKGMFGLDAAHAGKVEPAERAQVYAVLALGNLREQTFDTETGGYKSVLPSSTMLGIPPHFPAPIPGASGSSGPGSASALDSVMSQDDRYVTSSLTLFNAANNELDIIEKPSQTAVQALFLLHTYVSNTSMSRKSRDYIARAVMMAHELRLNERMHLSSHAAQAEATMSNTDMLRRRALLYLYVCFSDVYLSALEGHPPLIKRQDYDPKVFDYIDQSPPPTGVDTDSHTPLTSLRAFVDLVTTVGGLLEQLHIGYYGSKAHTEPSSQLVLRLQASLEGLRTRMGKDTFGAEGANSSIAEIRQTAKAGSLIRQIHFHWSRIAICGPFLRDPLLQHSCLAICARSAMVILHVHRYVINAGLLNLPWMQLRRVAISIYVVFIALWRGEITAADAQTAVIDTLHVLTVFSTRWEAAQSVREIVHRLAEKSDLVVVVETPLYQPVHMPIMTQPVAPWATEHLSNEEASDLIQEILNMQNGADDLTSTNNYNDLMSSWPMT